MNKKLTPIQLILIGIGLLILGNLLLGGSYIARGFSAAIGLVAFAAIIIGVIQFVIGLFSRSDDTTTKTRKKNTKRFYEDDDDF